MAFTQIEAAGITSTSTVVLQNATVAGVITATSGFVGNLTGSVTGSVIGAVTGNVTGNLSGNVTGSITAGDKFLNTTGLGLGAMTTATRDALVSPPTGMLIFNSTNVAIECYFGAGVGWLQVKGSFSATGGSISQNPSGTINIHTYTSPGTFTVVGSPKSIDFLVVGAGGGGGNGNGTGFESGGGGGGGVVFGTRTITPGTYPIQVGGTTSPNTSGTPSFFTGSTTAIGGGAGGNGGQAGAPGGSGGGGAHPATGGGTGTPGQGNSGSPGGSSRGGGGGGYGSAGTLPSGGSGYTSSISGSPVGYAGGGAGGAGGSPGGSGGGAAPGGNATPNTGGGGGGANGPTAIGGNGGSGIVIIAYSLI
jgi:hypothetical protein